MQSFEAACEEGEVSILSTLPLDLCMTVVLIVMLVFLFKGPVIYRQLNFFVLFYIISHDKINR